MSEGSPRDATPRHTAPRPRRARPLRSDRPHRRGTPRRRRRKTSTDLAIEAAFEAAVATAPPLSEETRARLAELLSVNHRTRHRWAATKGVTGEPPVTPLLPLTAVTSRGSEPLASDWVLVNRTKPERPSDPPNGRGHLPPRLV